MKCSFIKRKNNRRRTGSALRQFGQGMTEYIIIVALIAIASIAAVSFFGQAIQGAFGGMASVLGGGTADAGRAAATAASAKAVAEATGEAKDLGSYDKTE